MANIVFGVGTMLLCVMGYLAAFRYFSRGRIGTALLLVVLSGFMLRVYTAADLHLHKWDERYHALVAKNMMTEPLHPKLYTDTILPYDYKDWSGNHTWVHKQPLPLWAMAGSMQIFGVHEFALRLPSVLLTTIGIALMFYIATFLFSPRVGILSAFLYSIHGLIIELSAGRVATDHFDVFFLFFIQLAVLLAIKFAQSKKAIFNILCGVSIGLAILSKWLPALIVLPIWLLLLLDSKQFSRIQIIVNGLVLCAVTALVFLPWQLYIFQEFPLEAQWERSFNQKHLTEALDGQGGPFYYHIDKARILFGELVYLPLLWFLWKSGRRLQNYRRLLLAIWFAVPFLFFSLAATKMQGYTLFSAPAIFIIIALFWDYLYRYRNAFRFKFLVSVILVLLLALPVRYSIERVKPFTARDRNPPWARELRSLHSTIETYGPERTVVFNAPRPIETMFYTGCTAYSYLPAPAVLDRVRKKGYTILLRSENDEGLEAEYRLLE